jgi:hypothetical protein
LKQFFLDIRETIVGKNDILIVKKHQISDLGSEQKREITNNKRFKLEYFKFNKVKDFEIDLKK